MLKIFKFSGIAEGISAILLFFFAMPMKYMFADPSYIRPIGMAHGLLFTVYAILAFMLKYEENWTWKKLGIVLLAAIVPGGTFYVDWKYLKTKSA